MAPQDKGKMENAESCVVPLEIISEEEMAWIEAALSFSASHSNSNSSAASSLPPPIQMPMLDTTANESEIVCSKGVDIDIEDSPLRRHRQRRALSVTDITASEWCEKQMEFMLIRGRPEKTAAMKVGSARHTELETEVLVRVELDIRSKEDSWAVRLVNFIVGVNQLLFDGMTRELPVVGLVEGVWLIGIIDEVRMCEQNGMKRPLLVDTKTRSRSAPPSEPQKRNARLQLMCYKFLWDNIVTSEFPSSSFFQYFGLRPQRSLSKDIRKHIADSGIGKKVQSLNDLIKIYKRTCKSLPLAHGPLLIRYELQADRSLLGEEEFCFEASWMESRLRWHLQYWLGKRAAEYVPEDESWKCQYCSFSAVCPRVQLLSHEEK